MPDQNLKQRIVKNSFWIFMSSVINRVGTLFFTILLARYLLPEAYGIYNLALSVILLFLTLSSLGLDNVVTKYISSVLLKKKHQLSSYNIYFLKLKLKLTTLSLLLLFLAAYPLSRYIFKINELFFLLIIGSLYLLFQTFESYFTQLFYCIEKTKYTSYKEIINQLLKLVFLFLILIFFRSSLWVILIFITLGFTSLILLIYDLITLKKILPELFSKEYHEKIETKNILKFIWFLSFASISAIIFSHVDSLMLGSFLAPEYVGYYKAAFSFVMGVGGIIAFPNLILYPIFSKMHINNIEDLQNKSVKYMSIVIIPAMFGLLALGRYFIVFLFGMDYYNSYLPLAILSFLILPHIFVGQFISIFTAEEKPKIITTLMIIISILNVVLNYIFIKIFISFSPLLATAGVSLATVMSWYIYLFITFRMLKKELLIKVNYHYLLKPLLASLGMYATLFLIIRTISDMNIPWGILLILIGILVYLVGLILLKGIKKEDLNLIRDGLKK